MNFLTNSSLYKLKSTFVFHFLKFFFNLFINIHLFISDYLTVFLFYIYIQKIRIKIKKQPLHKHMLNYSDRTRLNTTKTTEAVHGLAIVAGCQIPMSVVRAHTWVKKKRTLQKFGTVVFGFGLEGDS